ncbi:hypothetical protein KKF61_00005, partial [Patescibacteria group bacterium]|nr:hypothetical protein [Patescibacteria group bacterium]
EQSGWNKSQINNALGSIHKPQHDTISIKPHKFSRKKIIIIAVIVICALLIGGGVFAYIKGYLPIPFLTKSADDLVLSSFTKLAEAKGGEFGFNFHIQTEGRASDVKPFSIKKVTGDSPAQIASQDATTMSNASQLRTALVLYADDNKNTYPNSLDELALSYISKVPAQGDGISFNYSVSSDKKSFTIKYTCLSGDNAGPGTLNEKGDMTSCTEGQGSNEAISSILSAYLSTELLAFIPTDLDLQGELTVFMNYNEEESDKNKGIFSLNGSYSSAGTTMSADAEVRYTDKKAYILIRQFPSLIFFDITPLMNKWIMFDSESGQNSFIPFNLEDTQEILPAKDVTDTIRTELAHIARLAFEKDLIITNIEGSETLDGHPTHRIAITIDPEKLPAFSEAYRDDALNRHVDLKQYENMLKNLEDPAVIEKIKEFTKNFTLKVWIDQSGSAPRKLEIDTIIAPSDKVEKLKDKQIRFNFALTFDHLGEKPNVKVPDDAIDMDEVERLITGKSIEDQKLDKQTEAISDLRSALTNYERKNKKFPDSLDKLLEKPPTNANTNFTNTFSMSSLTNSYFYSYDDRTSIPEDLYTDKPFEYESTGDDYRLIYTIQFPEQTEEEEDEDFGSLFSSDYSYSRSKYVEGKNTATKQSLSLEAEVNKDTDQDGLTDIKEAELGTSKYSKDTDRDGYDDKTEVDNGFDPLKK